MPQRILVAHHLLLGDTLMLTPLLAKCRALWPSASTTWSARNSLPLLRVTPRRRRMPEASTSTSTSSTRLPKRISPPSDSMVARMRSTIDTSRNVPMCGLLT